jgi:putative ABC transport system permease protein
VQAEEQIYLSVEAETKGRRLTLPVIGCSENWLEWCGAQLTGGRMLYPPEWNAASRVAMIGETAARKAELSAGDRIFVGNVVLTLCGILQSGGSFGRISVEDALIVPVKALAEWTDSTIHEVMLGVVPGTSPERTAAMAQQMLQRIRGAEVDTLTMQVQMEAADSVVTTFVDVLKWVALICVLVGGIGVMNILLVGVRERRREIGVMKSLGTSYSQIRMLFLMEALAYAVIGGILGVMIGLGLTDLAGRSIGLLPAVRLSDCVMVVGVAVCAGVFFGVAPASRAARLSPVDALRQE